MKQYENDQTVANQDAADQTAEDGSLDVDALYAQCIEIEARDYAVGRVLCAIVRHLAGAQGLDVPEHEAQAVAAMGTQIVTPDEETQPDTMPVQDADVSTSDAPAYVKETNDYGN